MRRGGKMATNSKVGGNVLAEVEGLTITVALQKAKGSGKNRVWIQIRQNVKPKRWRVSTSLAYARSLDVQFVEEPEV
jgi:hypothetical protein